MRCTTRRNRHRRIIAKDKPACHWCLEDIDYQADWLHPLAFQIDHVIPLHKGGLDELSNIVAAHRRCNRAKSDKIPLPPGATFVTERSW
jgi:5-methylcytosine-specific restriction endonuclease McrA